MLFLPKPCHVCYSYQQILQCYSYLVRWRLSSCTAISLDLKSFSSFRMTALSLQPWDMNLQLTRPDNSLQPRLLNLVHCWRNHMFPRQASLMQHPWPAQLLYGIGKGCWCVSSIACVYSQIYVTLFQSTYQ